ncbi:hypothetical protein [uncultured Tateyamaria sp.]|uniref:hypothetical protein n=1 Tax=uncultured Tateyamaria sp. TaxID=455651 RepID=UPI0026290B74|nr:hypothetical protein [uncultured Tateyamaria sp.]
MLNLDHAFFAPAWRRYLTVAICVLWGLFELSTGAVIWGVIFLGLAALAQWQFMRVDWSKYDGGH